MPATNNLTLIGMPGVGKSTVGVLLAKQIGYAFMDTDLLIQSGENLRLKELIDRLGGNGFLDLEADYIRTIDTSKTVIATGGSVIYRRHAMAHLKSLGPVAYLQIQREPLQKRLENLDERGVVIADGQSLETLYNERTPLYRQYADLTITTDGCTPEQVVHTIRQALDQKARPRIP